MRREKIIKKIWEYGMNHPNFQIAELEKYLNKITRCNEDDVHFGIAYVERNFIRNMDLDEYLIDQNSISSYISNKQYRMAVIAAVVAFISLVAGILFSHKGSSIN